MGFEIVGCPDPTFIVTREPVNLTTPIERGPGHSIHEREAGLLKRMIVEMLVERTVVILPLVIQTLGSSDADREAYFLTWG